MLRNHPEAIGSIPIRRIFVPGEEETFMEWRQSGDVISSDYVGES